MWYSETSDRREPRKVNQHYRWIIEWLNDSATDAMPVLTNIESTTRNIEKASDRAKENTIEISAICDEMRQPVCDKHERLTNIIVESVDKSIAQSRPVITEKEATINNAIKTSHVSSSNKITMSVKECTESVQYKLEELKQSLITQLLRPVHWMERQPKKII